MITGPGLLPPDAPRPKHGARSRLLKFRTMQVDVDNGVHREYIKATMSSDAPAGENGLYKLDRSDDHTVWTVAPQNEPRRAAAVHQRLIRGDMSLVGPRPCIPYETESFAPHHFDRFLVPAGITGLWQVTARA